jgi:hypothetical protein
MRRRFMFCRHLFAAALGLAAIGCGESGQGPSGPSAPAIPPAGPHFTVSPVPIETIARITPLGYNNQDIPTDHSYWLTCDIDVVLMGTRPCHRERQAIRAPRDGEVMDLNTAVDGFLSIEGPPGLRWTFGHVTPEAGLARGSRVAAGQVVARMAYDHGFDFGMFNYGITHAYAAPERYPAGYLHGEHPTAQFPEPLRSELTSRSNSLSLKLGRLDYDAVGTAAGAWFIVGTPPGESLQPASRARRTWLGRWVERESTRVAAIGHVWPGAPNVILAVDPAAPSWTDITPATGPVSLRLWNIALDASPNLSFPAGTVLVHLLSATSLRLEWFNTHGSVAGFTPAAKMYER